MKISIEYSNGKVIFQEEIFSWVHRFPREEDVAVAMKNIEVFGKISRAAYMHPRRKIIIRKDDDKVMVFPAISSKIKNKDAISSAAYDRSKCILEYLY